MASSPLFWVIALALCAGTLALLVVPLLRRAAAPSAPADDSAATAVFRDHKRQVDADFDARIITADERDAAIAELTRRFGEELSAPPAGTSEVGERTRWIAALVLVACLPVISGVLYFTLGNPAAIVASGAKATPQAGDRPHGTEDPQIASMVDQLAKKLEANPEDGEGWALLGRSYRAMGRFDAAALAYSQAAKRLPNESFVYSDWAEAVALAQGRSLAGQPTELLERALKLDPDNAKALALLGSAAMERNDRPTAVAMWTRLRSILPPDSPQRARLDEALAAAGAPQAPSAMPPPMSGGTPAAAPQGTQAAQGSAASGKSVEGRVEIDPKVAAKLAPTDTVFIFARDPDGPRMPLAAMKVSASELPRAFVLTDAMAMNPAATISKASKVVVEARVSKSGDVKPQAGDLSGASASVAPGARGVRVVIDRVVP